MENNDEHLDYKYILITILNNYSIRDDLREYIESKVKTTDLKNYSEIDDLTTIIHRVGYLASISAIANNPNVRKIIDVVFEDEHGYSYFIATTENLQNHPCLVDIMQTSAIATSDENACYVWWAAMDPKIAVSNCLSNLISTISDASFDNEGTSAQYIYYLATHDGMLANPLFPSIYHLIGTSKSYIQSKNAYEYILKYRSSIDENVLKMLNIITTTDYSDRLNDMLGFYEINIKTGDASKILEIIEFYANEEQSDLVATLRGIMFEEMPFDEKYKKIMALKPAAMVRRADNGNS